MIVISKIHCFLFQTVLRNTSMTGDIEIKSRYGIAINTDTVFLISVENDNFTIQHYPCKEFGVKDLDSSYSFQLKKQIFLCVEKTLFGFHREKQKWIRFKRMDAVRFGATCVSLKEGAIVSGGQKTNDSGARELSSSCILLRQEGKKIFACTAGNLPVKVRYHTMTAVSDDSFMMCGGMDSKGHESNEVFFGTLKKSPSRIQEDENNPGASTTAIGNKDPIGRNSGWYIAWKKLPNMWEWRSNHCAMFLKEQLYVFGGGPKRDGSEHRKELSLKHCGYDMGCFAGYKAESLPLRIEGDQVYCDTNFHRIHDMGYDISFANAVLSPDESYCVVAGGEIYSGGGLRTEEDKSLYLTMDTRSLKLKALEKNYEDDCFFINTIIEFGNMWKQFFSCGCWNPIIDK